MSNFSKCQSCGRTLKNPTLNGLGAVCARKHRNMPNNDNPVRVEAIYTTSTHRRYLVFTSPRVVVEVLESDAGRFATCPAHDVPGVLCEHIALAAQMDRARFPFDRPRYSDAIVEGMKINVS